MFGPLTGAIGGSDAIEIVVALRNLASEGFHKVEADVAKMEKTANATNLSGLSRTEKAAAKDAENLAKGTGGKGGLAGVAGGLLGLVSPAGLAITAIGAVAATALATLPTYERVEKQEKALAQAAVDHGIALDALNAHVEATIRTGEMYGYNADQTRAAIIKLTEAGMSLADQQAAMPHIMDLARAKNLDLADAARMYELAVMGNTRAVKDLGIALPKLTDAQKEHDKATKLVTVATDGLHKAQDHLAIVEASLASKHKITAADAVRLQQAHDAVRQATDKLKNAQHLLNGVQSTAADRAARLKLLNDDLNGAVGNQRNSVSGLDVKQAELNDKWERFATKIGPGVQAILGFIIDRLGNLIDALGWILNHLPTFQALQKSGNGYVGDTQYPKGGHAAGGWVGLHGPELGLLGEEGPEYIVPNNKLGNLAADSVHHVHVYLDGRQIADVVERHLGQRLNLRGSGIGIGSI